MQNPIPTKLPAKLLRTRRAFDKWRSTHKPRSRLPERLWSLAVESAREYGINRTARVLRLDYNGLKRRIASPATGKSTSVGSAPGQASSVAPVPGKAS